MSINFSILYENSANHHYVTRYIKFIQSIATRSDMIDGYYEKHHILPKSMYPEYKNLSTHPWNCVKLTMREHFLAHWMLAKAFGGPMWFSFNLMKSCFSKRYGVAFNTVKLFEISANKNRPKHTEKTKQKISNTTKNRKKSPLSAETKNKISLALNGQKYSKERKLTHVSGMAGKTHTSDSKQKMSNSHKGKKLSDITKKKLSDINKGKLDEKWGEKTGAARKGKSYYTNGHTTIMIYPEDVEHFLQKGFIKGRLCNGKIITSMK
jgi:hypothetical protein